MEPRSYESQMDFEYNNNTGPVDLMSPWLQHTKSAANDTDTLAKKRSFQEYNSPKKPSMFSNQSADSNKSFIFQASPTRQWPATPKGPAWAPRNIESGYNSSGAENASSPEIQPDSDATPDLAPRTRTGSSLSRMNNANASAIAKSIKAPASFKPFVTSGKENFYRSRTEGIMKKIKQTRRKESDRRLVPREDVRSSGSDTDEAPSKEDSRKGFREKTPSAVSSLFLFIENHPDIPHILSYYAQLLLNTFLVFSVMYMIYSFWATIRSDVDKQSEEAITNTLAEIAKCASDYRDNRCEKDSRAPALELACLNWERCMKKDARSVGRAKVSAHAFAEILNSFIEPISYKTMIFSSILVFGCILTSNLAFGFFRSRISHQSTPYETQAYTGYVPTPRQDVDNFGWDAYKSPQAGMERLRPSQKISAQTPSRRLQYNR